MNGDHPDNCDPVTDQNIQELLNCQKLTIILVYVDDIAVASSIPGGHWINQMLRDQFIIKPTGGIQSCGDTVQFLGISVPKIATGFSLGIKTALPG